MRINFFNVDEFCETLPEITTNKIYAKKGFHQNGLFSEKIFGPVRTCTCACGVYWGRSKIGEKCATCGVEIGYSSLRRTKFAKIGLPFPVMNPIMYYLILKAGKTTIGNVIHSMIFDDSVMGYYYDEKTKKYIVVKTPAIDTEMEELPEGVVLYSGPTGIYELTKHEADKNKETNTSWLYIYENIDKFFMTNVIVCPPEFRPVSKTKDVQMRDKMNEFYMTILNFSMMLQNDVSTYENSEIQLINFKNLQRYVFDYYEYVFSKFSKKTGLIRGSILGKRIDFSARAVITPDPSLNLDECSLPYMMILELYKLNIVNRLLEIKNFKDHRFVRYDPTIDFVNDCIKMNDTCLLEVVEEVVNGKTVILNRQPTLHRMGLLSFNVKINTDYVIKIHPLVCEPYNADFDGDQMAVYISLYDSTEQENKDKIHILANLISPSTGKLIVGANQDILLGIYLLTKPDENKKTVYNGDMTVIDSNGPTTDKNTYEGRIIFNSILPDNFPFINKVINKKELSVLLNVLAKIYDANTMKTILDAIKELGFKETTLKGSTFSLKELHGEESFNAISESIDDESMSLMEKFITLQTHPMRQQLRDSFPYSDFIESGSRGSWEQADQLIFCRGYMSNSQGQIVETPIKNNLVHGLTREEFFTSCYGSRKALLDVALNTAVSGYLTRKLVYCNVNLEMDNELEDCGTTDHFKIVIPSLLTDDKIEELVSHIPDEKQRQIERDILKHKNDEMDPVKLSKSLIGRWKQNMDINGNVTHDLITEDNYDQLFGSTVHVRSPIFCKSPRLCKKCFGTLHKHCHSPYVGVISAQALGEVATQLTLRTFHVGGIAQMSAGQSETSQQDIISDLTIVNKLLHGTMKVNYHDLITKLFSIYARHKVLLLVHFEVVVSQMMRVENIRWRLCPDRETQEPNLVSIENVPSRESFLLALAFSKPYNYIVSGILGDGQTTDGILERMLTNSI